MQGVPGKTEKRISGLNRAGSAGHLRRNCEDAVPCVPARVRQCRFARSNKRTHTAIGEPPLVPPHALAERRTSDVEPVAEIEVVLPAGLAHVAADGMCGRAPGPRAETATNAIMRPGLGEAAWTPLRAADRKPDGPGENSRRHPPPVPAREAPGRTQPFAHGQARERPLREAPPPACFRSPKSALVSPP